MKIIARTKVMKRRNHHHRVRKMLGLLLGLCVFVCLGTSTVMAQRLAPNFINTDEYAGNANDVTVNLPAGSIAGDVVLVYVVQDDDDSAIIDDSGLFTQLYNLTGSTAGPRSALFYRVITGTEPASVIFDLNAEPGIVTVLRFRGLDPVMPFVADNGVQGSSDSPTAPSVTTTASNITYLHFIGIDGASAGTLSASSGSATVEATAQSSTATSGHVEMMITSQLQSAAGATPEGVFTFDASDTWTAITLALNYAPVEITSPATGQCITSATTLTANYEISSSSGTFELVDPSGTVVATDSYSSATGTVSFNFTPMLTGNYTVRDQALTTFNSFITIYVDTDGDTVCDLFDMDDDNDGIIDNVESPNCFLSTSPYESGDRRNLIGVTTEWPAITGDISDVLNGATDDNAVFRSGDHTFTGEEFLHFTFPEPVTVLDMTIYHEGTVFIDIALVGVVQGSNDGTNWTDLTSPGAVVLPRANSPHVLTLTQNTSDYLEYRIFVTGGRTDSGEYLREVEFTTIFNPLNFPVATCTDDADGDLVVNHLDLDSDNDGCSDALEAGATSSTVTDFQFPSGSAGANGLPDAVETPAESGNINYPSTYQPDALTNTIQGCGDNDGDLVINAIDLDDDNDGILDTDEENGACLGGDDLLNWTRYTLPGDISSNADIPGNPVAATGTSGVVNLVGSSGDNFGLIFTGFILIQETGTYTFELSSNNGSNLNIGGTEVIDISGAAAATASSATGTISLSPGWYDLEVRYYENAGVQALSLEYQSPSAGSLEVIPSEFFSTFKPPCDDDIVINRWDLDSDNDGIPDNVEAQSTNGYIPPNPDSPAMYAINNGVNSAYLGGLPLTDTDMDGIPDYLDRDSDSDRIPDNEESGFMLTGLIGANGLDMSIKTSDDYADVNGIVNNPSTDLAKVTSTDPNEVDYRDKQPPPTINVCYNSNGGFTLGGSIMDWLDNKLENPVNFGEFGTSYYNMNLIDLGDGTDITSAMLVAQGCQIMFMGGTSGLGSDGTSFTQAESFSAAALVAISDWGLSPNNVIIAFQGASVQVGGTELVNGVETNLFAGSNSNSNPNRLTMLGEEVISGDFGQTTEFNQGGSFQGHFTMFPDYACAISEDNSDPPRPTGLLNGQTGDFYLADFGLVDHNGDATRTANITSNNDRLFANLMASAARVALEGPEDVCSFFLCPAGDEAPMLTSADVTSAGLPVDLNTLFTATPPAGTTLTWHTMTPAADDNYIARSANYTESGVVHAAFRAADGSCYSPTTPLMVTVNYPDLAVTVSPGTETSFQGQVQTFTVTVTNNGPITAPDAEVKIPIPGGRELVLANPSAGSYSGSTYVWSVGQLSNGQSETLDITLRIQ